MSFLSSASSRTPKLDQARAGIAKRVVDRIADVGGMDAAINRFVAEHVIDGLQDRRARPERIGERDLIEFQARVGEFPLQFAATLVELAGRRALEREDRLLFVADGKHGAEHAVAGTPARRELGDDMRHDVPLSRTRVLRLVDQDVVDAAVELVVHPSRRDALQHRKRLVDQVVIVEQSAILLLAAVIGRRRGCDMKQRFGPVACDHGPALLDQRAKADDFIVEQPCHRWIVVAEGLCQHRLAREFLVGEKHRQIRVDLGAARRRHRLAQLMALIAVRLGA